MPPRAGQPYRVTGVHAGPQPPALLDRRWWIRALSPAEQVAEAWVEQPDWVRVLDAALECASPTGRTGPVPAGDAPHIHFVPALVPFLDTAEALLLERLADHPAGRPEDRCYDTAAVVRSVRDWLGVHLAGLAAPTFVAELEEARASGSLTGATPQDRFADFLRTIGSRHVLAELFDRLPVLARLLAEATARAVDAVAELLARLEADRAAWRALLPGAVPGLVTGLVPGRGDLHGRGQSVVLLSFADGSKLIYKPRPVGMLRRFEAIQTWFAGHRPDLASRAVRVVQREGYGWAEFAERTACREPAQVERFYRRLGALLALLYVLDGTDMHYENLIAAGEHPVLVDVETLLHPTWVPGTDAGSDPALAFLQESVMRTGLLPSHVLGERGALDISGVGGGDEALYPDDTDVLVDGDTDRARLEPGRVVIPAGLNRPVLDGCDVDPRDYADSAASGFRSGYETLLRHAHELQAPGGPLEDLAGEQLRVVARPTLVYGVLLAEARRPAALGEGAGRADVFTALADDPRHTQRSALIPVEAEELYRGDIPLFTAAAGSRDLISASGDPVPGLLERSGLEALQLKLARLGAADRQAQEWLVEAAFATKRGNAGHQDPLPVPVDYPVAAAGADRLIRLACGIGDELLARSHQDSWRVNWIGLQPVDERYWSVRPLGADLADGYCGTALFLAQLGRITGTPRYLDAARQALNGLPQLITAIAASPELAVHVGPGGFAGFGGIAYALSRLSRLLDDETLRSCLPAAVELVVASVAPVASGEHTSSGVALGAAGGVAALLAVEADTGLAVARRAADRLARHLDGPDALPSEGFLHGEPGRFWALRRLFLARNPAGTPESGTPTTETLPPGPGTSVSWCSGAAGHVLGALDTGPPEAVRPAVDAFVRAVSRRIPSADNSLCHGDLGLVETLMTAAAAGHEGAGETLTAAMARLAVALQDGGPRCGTPGAISTPGLLRGTAGIGYGLLRLALPNQVPSILLLKPAGRPGSTA